MNIEKLKETLAFNNQPAFRIKQILKAIFQDGIGSFSEITTLPKALRESLDEKNPVLSFEVIKVLKGKHDNSAKALLKLSDGNFIETVLIEPKPNLWSVCVSCQVGCQMGCRFCATGKMGFVRDLNVEEITDQVLFWNQYLKKNPQSFQNSKIKIKNSYISVGNIVYMGMGEPFNNWQNVSQSIKILTDKELFGFGSRAISVSTSGIAEGIVRMGKEFPQVNLAISLHFADDEKRSNYMPVNQKDDLGRISEALKEYFSLTKRKVFIEYILLENLNDSSKDAVELADYLASIGNKHLLHVNLIRYNATPGGFAPSSKKIAEAFKNNLQRLGIGATIRKSMGEEIQGACGQLAGR